jgi:hypothetical protein
VKAVDSTQAEEMVPPAGTAIVRPLQHVRAVRERYLQRFMDPVELGASRSARAWAWALGETAVAPVTDRVTSAPPDRSEIQAEIAAADERRLRGSQEDRADGAAIILAWLVGADDHVPVRCASPGELVGGFDDVVRSHRQLADIAALAAQAHRVATAKSRDIKSHPGERERAGQEMDYLNGAMATLAWASGERTAAPISHGQHPDGMAKALKRERIYAEDAIEQAGDQRVSGSLPSRWYGEGVKSTIAWLLGDTINPR